MSAPAPGLPPLSLSTGPAISSATGSANGTVSAPFNFKRDPVWLDLVKSVAPLVIVAGAAWLVMRR